jgi:ubiquinone/menaquinone biosynthesis C-methylase UbiE
MMVRLGQWFARFVTDVVVRRPALWRVFRPLFRLQFERLAPVWDTNRNPMRTAPFELALDAIDSTDVHDALDVGTGTGDGALVLADRFPGAHVVGVDVSGAMLAEAKRKLPPELRERVRFEEADAAKLPYGDASFDLVAHSNMLPFFDEIARVLRPRGYVLFSFTAGPETPIYVPPERLRAELERRSFTDFAEFDIGRGTAFVARSR